MGPYARLLGYDGPPFEWDPERRTLLRAEIDAAMMHVYGLERPEAEHVLDSFAVLRRYEERDFGEFRTKRLVLEFFDSMADSSRSNSDAPASWVASGEAPLPPRVRSAATGRPKTRGDSDE